VFPARYELNSYIVFRKRLVSKRLNPWPYEYKTGTIPTGKQVGSGGNVSKVPGLNLGQDAIYAQRYYMDLFRSSKPILIQREMEPILYAGNILYCAIFLGQLYMIKLEIYLQRTI
jgi:hypothetical protein